MPKKLKIKDIPSIDRPREKMKAKGPQNLKDSELFGHSFRNRISGKECY